MTSIDLASLADLVFARLRETAGQGTCDDHFAIDKWEWPQGVALYSLYRRYARDGSEKDLAFLESWFERNIAKGLPVRNVNTTAPLLTLCCLLEHGGHPAWHALCLEWAEWVMYAMPRTEELGVQHITSHLVNPGELWADTLFMTVLFLAKSGRVFKRPEFVEEASYQILLHLRYLADAQTGLWFHGWSFVGRHYYGRVRWARGNAWFSLAAVEFLEIAPPDISVRRTIEQVFVAQFQALASCQASDGLWHTILDDETSYTESSASAAFAYAALKAVRTGLLPASWLELAERAVQGVIARIDGNGTVGGVSHGTALGMDSAHYRTIPQAPTAYGQGLAFLMLTEYQDMIQRKAKE